MGAGRWDNATRTAYASYTDTAKTLSVHENFTSRYLKEYLDPKKITLRESCDSEQNPLSRAIIIGLDVTGSMGMIAHKIATEGLGTLIEGIYDRKPVEDPHVMFMGIGDVHWDDSPLQASQFEADIRILEQLKDLYIEGGGGGNGFESYDLPWYFAAQKTTIDCFEKRNQKGYLFTIGDEGVPDGLGVHNLQKVFGSKDEHHYKAAELLEMAQKKYEVFHIIVEQGHYASRLLDSVTGQWRELLGKRAIFLSNYNHIAEVILSVLEVAEGADPEDVLASWEKADVRKTVRHALFD